MPFDSHSNQIVPERAFEPPQPLAEGSVEADFARHRARFARRPFNLEKENVRRGYAAFKVWHHKERERAAEHLAHIPPDFSD